MLLSLSGAGDYRQHGTVPRAAASTTRYNPWRGSAAEGQQPSTIDVVITRAASLSPMLQRLVAFVSQRCPENVETGRQGQTTWEN